MRTGSPAGVPQPAGLLRGRWGRLPLSTPGAQELVTWARGCHSLQGTTRFAFTLLALSWRRRALLCRGRLAIPSASNRDDLPAGAPGPAVITDPAFCACGISSSSTAARHRVNGTEFIPCSLQTVRSALH